MEEQSVEDIYRHLWEQDEKAKEVNRSFVFRKKDFLIMMGGFSFLILSIVFLVIDAQTVGDFFEYLSLACLVFSLIFVEGPAVVVMIKALSRPVRSTLEPIAQASKSDYALAQELARSTYSKLEHVKERLEAEKEAVIGKVSIMVGVMHKTGLIPTAIAFFVSLNQVADQESSFPWAEVTILLVAIYLMSFLISLVCFRIDRCLVTLNTAIRVKDEQEDC